ncbi:MAG: Asd/ArgC dimerization domain-containing protein [Terriglobia bacterium]
MLAESSLGSRVRLVAAKDDEAGKLTEIAGAAAFLARLEPDAVEDAAVIILAGTPESSREVLNAKPAGLIVDLTYQTEDDPEARVRAPQVEGPEFEPEEAGPQVVAHPAATAIAVVMERLHRAYPIASAIVHVFEPASERGKPGIDELQQQTVNLLSFQPLPKKLFDAQLSFNMLARLGDEAATRLNEIEERIERHLATLLDRSDGVPMPSLRLIQAPVFHGYSFSLWIEFEDAPVPSDIEDALAGDFVDVRGGDLEPPSNVGVAGQSGISAGEVTPDRNNGNAIWMWMAVDNLRLPAEGAAMLARGVL